MLALAVGLATAASTVVDALAIRPLPFRGADRLMGIWLQPGPMEVPSTLLRAWRQSPAFENVEGFGEGGRVLIESGAASAAANVAFVTPGALSMLGVRPLLGRLFDQSDAALGTGSTAIVSEDLWRRVLASNPAAIGRQIRVHGRNMTIVAVMPRAFQFPSAHVSLWRLSSDGQRVRPIVRLAAGVPERDALAVASALSRPAGVRSPLPSAVRHGLVQSGWVDSYARGIVAMLAGAVCLVFLVFCLNVSGLLLARFTGRAREFGLCTALGASRTRLVQQSLTEGAILGGFGSVGGVALAWLLVAAANALLPATLAAQTLNALDLDARSLLFAAVASTVGVGLAAALPAWVGTRRAGIADSRLAGRSQTEPRRSRRLLRAFLIVEIALACVLAVGAILFVRTFLNLTRMPLGYDPVGLTTIAFAVDDRGAAGRASVSRALADLIGAMPGVTRVALSGGSPLRPAAFLAGAVQPDTPGSQPLALQVQLHRVDDAFFDLYGIRLTRGRLFRPSDGPGEVILGARMASALWHTTDPVGRLLTWADRSYRVIGVVDETTRPVINPDLIWYDFYVPFGSSGPDAQFQSMALTFRCGATCPSEGDIRQHVQGILPGVRVSEVLRFEEAYREDLAQPRAAAALGLGLAAIGLAGAAGGLFSVLTYSVSRRRREFGIRLALGSSARTIWALVFKEGATIAVAGLCVGSVFGWWLARSASVLQFGVTASDPETWAVVAAAIALTAVLACWWPARDAMHTDPLALLREE
jgi:predicted permease